MIGTVFDSATTSLATECILDAEAEVNKFLAKRYDLSSNYFQTSTATPPLVRTIARWLAQGYMYDQMARGTESKRAAALIKRGLDNLELIRDGKSELFDTAGSILPESTDSASRVLSNTSDYSNTFNEDDELSWRVDDDKLDDIDSERD
jgi:hypothetical protein